MSDAEKLWERRSVEAIGVSVEVYLPWPLETRIEPDGGNLYQLVADTGGLVFLRYGYDMTVENFVAMRSDFVTKASVTGDEQLVYCDRPARRLTIRSVRQSLGVYSEEPGGGLTHGRSPGVNKIIRVIGFDRRSQPVLFGYEMPEEKLPQHQHVLERILGSGSSLP